MAVLTQLALAADFDPKNPASVRAERQRILKEYKDDPARLASELEKYAQRIAEANGRAQTFARTQELRKKYGPFRDAINVLPHGDSEPIIIDADAWRAEVDSTQVDVRLRFTLDSQRYKAVRPPHPTAVFRTRGSTPQAETEMRSGVRIRDALRIYPQLELAPDGSVIVFLQVPADKRPYVIDISAGIEKGLIAQSTFEIDRLLGISNSHSIISGVRDSTQVDKQPEAISPKPPAFPPALKGTSISGDVEIVAVIADDGAVLECVAAKAHHPEFEKAAIAAVKRWAFRPAEVNGKAVPCRIKIPIVFVP